MHYFQKFFVHLSVQSRVSIRTGKRKLIVKTLTTTAWLRGDAATINFDKI